MEELVVSFHHDWRGPASYAIEDRNVVLCMDCGVRCVIGQWVDVPDCRPKVEMASSGLGGVPLSEYLTQIERE